MHDRLVDVTALRALCAERGCSMTELSKRSGVSYSLIRKVNRGIRELSDLTAYKVARALDCRIEDFSVPKPAITQDRAVA